MKPLFTTLSFLSLLVGVAITSLWVYSYWHEGNIHWSRHLSPLFDERADGIMGYTLDADWNASWERGELVIFNEYMAQGDWNPYVSPPGFPVDHQIVSQYEQGWAARVKESAQGIPTSGCEPKARMMGSEDGNWLLRRGFDWRWERFPRTGAEMSWRSGGYRGVWFPAWVPLALTLVPPTAWLARFFRRRRRAAKHLCADCGYDLRATPQRCPECGAVGQGQMPPVASASPVS